MNLSIPLVVLWFLSFAGCGGSVCEDACEKQKSCAESLQCHSADPVGASSCEQTRKQLASVDCSKLSLPEVCSDQLKVNADAVMKCTLNPQTCQCPY